MCGIVAIAGVSNVVPRLLKSLHALEYRGYDSAGIAVSVPGAIQTCRAVGRITNLEARLADAPLSGDAGLAHTRWATHGAPTESNAHPLSTSAVSLVHNGIIENYRQLRRMLENEGRTFKSETDTETVLQLADAFLAEGKPPVEAVRACVAELRGAFALVFVFRDHPGLLIAARRGSPLALGLGEHENFVASDALALAPHASKVAYLEESDLASVTRHSVQVEDSTQRPVVRQARPIEAGQTVLDTGGHRHFMAKEIHEQPGVLGGLLARRLAASHSEVLPLAIPDTDPNQPLDLIACGTANYAAMVGERWIEEIADIRAKSQLASEFRYRPTPSGPTALAVFVSQSGETADTLAALRLCRQQGRPTIGIVNVEESSVAREADTVLATHAGPEIGVASTKAFSAQLATLAFPGSPSRPEARDTGCPRRKPYSGGSFRDASPDGRSHRIRRSHSFDRNLGLPDQARPLSRARDHVSCRTGRRSQTERNHLYARGRVCGRRIETWSDRVGRSECRHCPCWRRGTASSKNQFQTCRK